MKKIISLAVSAACILSLAGCNSSDAGSTVSSKAETTAETSAETVAEVPTETPTAKSIYDTLKSSVTSVGNYVEYTEDTDTNGLLGRPNQYTQKINFADTAIEQSDESDPQGGSIEVFATSEDAQSRADYIDSVTQDTPTLQEYHYINGTVLLRLSYDITPSVAKEYEQAFNSAF